MCGRRGSGRARQEQSSSGILTAALGAALASRHAHPGPRYSPTTLVPDLREDDGTMRERRDSGAAGTEATAALQRRAPDGGGAAPPGRAPALAVGQWELLGCLRGRSRGRGRGSAWETGLRLGRLTIAPPPAGQSATADTGAGRSELSWRLTTGARWVPGCIPAPARGRKDAVSRAPGLPQPARPGDRWDRPRRRGWRGTATEPLTKRPWEGRAASASTHNRAAKLPVILHRWRWPMTRREGARVGARARLGISGIGRR